MEPDTYWITGLTAWDELNACRPELRDGIGTWPSDMFLRGHEAGMHDALHLQDRSAAPRSCSMGKSREDTQ